MLAPEIPVSKPNELCFPVLFVVVIKEFSVADEVANPHLSEVTSPSPVEFIANPQVYSAPKDTFGAKNHSTPIKPCNPNIKVEPFLLSVVLGPLPEVVVPAIKLSVQTAPPVASENE